MKWPADILKSLPGMFGELSPTCREAARLQSEALDRPLAFHQRIGLRVHLLLCKWCRRYGGQLRFLRSVGQQQDGQDVVLPVQKLRPAAVERMKQHLQAAERNNDQHV